ncbi:MAG: radical SAM protein [Verrucomicrobiales bacterium]|nr:radical SAM protein [Verrucomicrobiales bacterium]
MPHPVCLLTCSLPLDASVGAWLAELRSALACEHLDLVVLTHDVRVSTPFPVLTLPISLRDFASPAGIPADTTPGTWDRTALRLARRDRAWSGADAEDLVPFLEGHAACEHALGQLLAILQPALVLTWGSSLPPSLVLRSCCDQLQIPTFVLERGLLPETLMLDQRGHGALSDLNTCLLAAHLGDTPDDEACYRQIRDYYRSRRTSKYPQAASLSRAEFQARHNPDNRPTLAFVGQYDHGAGLTPPDSPGARLESPFFTSTADCLAQLGRALADCPDRRLLFKPHPLDPTDYSSAESPTTRVLCDVSLFDLFEYADVLAFTSSTSIFEALLYEKPCVLLARSQLSHKGATYELRDLGDLGSLLDHAFAGHDFDTLRRRQRGWVQAICRHYLVGLKPDVPTRLHLPDLARFLAQNAAPTQPCAPLDTLLPHARLALPASRLVSSPDPVVQASSLHAPDHTSLPADPSTPRLDPLRSHDLAAARDSLRALQAARTEAARFDQLAREREQTIEHLDNICRERQATIEHLDRLCRERDATICELRARASAVLSACSPPPDAATSGPHTPPDSTPPDPLQHRLRQAETCRQQGDLTGAGRAFEAVLDVAPNHIPARLGLAHCEYQEGDLVAARLDYLHVLKLDPTNETASTNLQLLEAKRAEFMSRSCPIEVDPATDCPQLRERYGAREYPCPSPFRQLYLVPRRNLDVRFCSYHPPVFFDHQESLYREGIDAFDCILNTNETLRRRRGLFLEGRYLEAGCSENCGWYNRWKVTGQGHRLTDYLRADDQFRLGNIWLSMGPDCNVTCRYCLEPAEFHTDFRTCSPAVMSLARDFVRRGGDLLLTGGETFLPKWGFARILVDLVAGETARGKISLHTNGTYLNERNRDLLLRGPLWSVGISMDTLRPELYEYLRRGTRFEHVWRNATRLLQERATRGQQLPHITLLCAVMKCTSGHLRETVDRATQAGFGISLNALFQSYYSPQFSRQQGLQNLSRTELDDLYHTIQGIEQDYGPNGPVNYQGFKGQVEHLLQCAATGTGETQVILGGGGQAPRLDHFRDIEAAEQLLVQRRFAQARLLLEPLRDRAARSTRFLHALAELEAGESDGPAAALCYRRILKLDPRDTRAREWLDCHPDAEGVGTPPASLPRETVPCL